MVKKNIKYTIVSPTEGIYHVNPYGRHEELLKFVKESAQERYFLPTDFVLSAAAGRWALVHVGS